MISPCLYSEKRLSVSRCLGLHCFAEPGEPRHLFFFSALEVRSDASNTSYIAHTFDLGSPILLHFFLSSSLRKYRDIWVCYSGLRVELIIVAPRPPYSPSSTSHLLSCSAKIPPNKMIMISQAVVSKKLVIFDE
jgi:hypothetical protein